MASNARKRIKHKFKVGERAYLRPPGGLGERVKVTIRAVQIVTLYTCDSIPDKDGKGFTSCAREDDLLSKEEFVAKRLMESI